MIGVEPVIIPYTTVSKTYTFNLPKQYNILTVRRLIYGTIMSIVLV